MKYQKQRTELNRHKWINVGDYVRIDAEKVNQGLILQASRVMLGSTYKVKRIVKDGGNYVIYAHRWNKAHRKFNKSPVRFVPFELVEAEDPR